MLCVIEGLDCMEFTQQLSTFSSPTAKIKGKANDVDIVLRVYYRPPNQEDDTNYLFYKELRDSFRSAALALMGYFNFINVI